MPLGSLSVTAEGVPIFAPPYPRHKDPYTFIIDKILSVSYRVAASQVRHLVPDMLELEDEPLMTSFFIEYGMTLVGSYKEYVHNVEVTYKGERFNYNVILILDNESAIFAGREQYGFPKVFGKAEIEPETGGRPAGPSSTASSSPRHLSTTLLRRRSGPSTSAASSSLTRAWRPRSWSSSPCSWICTSQRSGPGRAGSTSRAARSIILGVSWTSCGMRVAS